METIRFTHSLSRERERKRCLYTIVAYPICFLRHVRREWALLSFRDVCLSVCLYVCMSVSTNGRASGRCCCCVAVAGCCIAAVMSRQDSGSCQTLLVLQFVIEFASIWAQYSALTYVSTHFSFFICVLMSKWQPCERDASCPYGLFYYNGCTDRAGFRHTGPSQPELL